MTIERHLLHETKSVRDALQKLNLLGSDAILFITDTDARLLGSLTDGDLRRGFLKGLTFDHALIQFIKPNPTYILQDELHLADIDAYKDQNLKIIPVTDRNKIIVDILNTRFTHAVIPADVIIMAGGRGERLLPHTKETPKPMLLVGDKPIIEHTIDRLQKYGIQHIQISVNYLADIIKNYLKDGSDKNIHIRYIEESVPMGTIGSVSLTKEFNHDTVLIMNSDLLTNIDLASFYKEFMDKKADMAVACVPYNVNIPYAIVDTHEDQIIGLKEKPTLSFYSNAGIYLVKRKHLELILENSFYNATDFIELLIASNLKVTYFPILDYWLDIGKIDDFKKAQEDIKHIKF